nr:hybrid signal transduction histidine kinase M [Tanacetum cinerariifolium]
MDMNHLTIFVLEKLDVDALNYSSWVYYFSHLCHGYGILDHLVDPVTSSSTTTPMDPPPKDAEWTKIDFIIRSWIFSTLAPSLRKHLVDLNPTTAKDAWTYIAGIFQDNKCPRAMALKAKLRTLKLGDLSIDRVYLPPMKRSLPLLLVGNPFLILKRLDPCSSLKASKDYILSSKGQELEATGIMWCAYYNIYNDVVDFVGRKNVPTLKVYTRSDGEYSKTSS